MLLILRIEKQMNRVKSLEIVPQINSLLIYDKDVTTEEKMVFSINMVDQWIFVWIKKLNLYLVLCIKIVLDRL